jgi:hypothetical protein
MFWLFESHQQALVKVAVKYALEEATKAQRESTSIALLFL